MLLYVFPCQIPIFDVLVHCASLSIVLPEFVPIFLPLLANIELVSDMDVVALLLAALADKAFVVDASETGASEMDAFEMDAFVMDAFVMDALEVVDIVVPWRSKTNLNICLSSAG